MNITSGTVIAAGLAGLLSACAGIVQKAETAPPPGDAFAQELHVGYAGLARSEHDENDFADAEFFAQRALSAANGTPPAPQSFAGRKLPGQTIPLLSDARQRLSRALDNGARKNTPHAAAKAQVAFDCWMQEQEENLQPDDIAACRRNFELAMTGIEVKSLAARKTVAPKPVPANLRTALRTPLSTRFVVYFDFDSARLAAASEPEVARAADAARRIGAAMVRVTGHTDRAGPEGHNLSLSRARAREVVEALRRVGLPEVGIATLAYGEEKPAIPTTDGKREPRNRRVEIELTH